MAEHTPGPWELLGDTGVQSATGIPLAETGASLRTTCDEDEANARFIVQACNWFDNLLAACELAVAYLEDGAVLTAADRLRTAIAKARCEQAFTLIEVLIVLAILGILVGIVATAVALGVA